MAEDTNLDDLLNARLGEIAGKHGTTPEALLAKHEASLAEKTARMLGLTARAAGPAGLGAAAGAMVGGAPGALAGAAAMGIGTPIADLGMKGYNWATGSNRPLPSESVENLMDKVGLPRPATPLERVAQTGGRGAIDALTGAGLAKTFVTPTAGPQIAKTLAERPGLQTASGATGGVAGQTAAEMGAGPIGTLLAGTIGGFAPGARISGYAERPSGPRIEHVNTLERAGVPLTPAQRGGGAPSAVLESVLKTIPTSAPQAGRVAEAGGAGYTRALLDHADANTYANHDPSKPVVADNIRPETLHEVQKGFGKTYDNLEARTVLHPDADFGVNLSNTLQTYPKEPGSFYPQLQNRVREIYGFVRSRAAGGNPADGKSYHSLDGQLRVDADRFSASDNPAAQQYGQTLRGIRDELAGLVERSAAKTDPGLADDWKKVNKDYALFSRIKEGAGSATGRDKLNTGHMPPSAMQQKLRADMGEEAYSRAIDPFSRFVRAGAAVLPDPVPNSGTAQRGLMQDLVTGKSGALGSAGGKATGAVFAGQVLGQLPALGYSLAVPPVVSALWHRKPVGNTVMGLLGAQGLRGASGEEDPAAQQLLGGLLSRH